MGYFFVFCFFYYYVDRIGKFFVYVIFNYVVWCNLKNKCLKVLDWIKIVYVFFKISGKMIDLNVLFIWYLFVNFLVV